MKNKDLSLSLNIAEIAFGILLTNIFFTDKVYEPVRPLEQNVAYAAPSQNLQVCELRKKIWQPETFIINSTGYGFIVSGAYSIGKRKR
ncbi:MAG: hypothetical protein Q8N63_04855 [Nanoarchaeota archaeon]|nr:hypothetical protein [Nanoarchaeota archaeon]